MPAALRSVAGPRALLPPLSPHLGPIVGLGAPGEDGGKDAARGAGGGGGRRGKEEGAREGRGGEGKPCATACPRGEHGRVVSVRASAPAAYFARPSVCLSGSGRKESQRAPREGVSKKKKKKKEPAWRRASVRGATDSLVVPPSTGVAAEAAAAAAAAAASGTSRVRG